VSNTSIVLALLKKYNLVPKTSAIRHKNVHKLHNGNDMVDQ